MIHYGLSTETIATVHGIERNGKWGYHRRNPVKAGFDKVIEVTAITVTETVPETKTLEGATEADKTEVQINV